MKRYLFTIPIWVILLTGCASIDEQFDIASPDGRTKVIFILSEGMPYYQLYYSDTLMIDTSALGIITNDDPAMKGPFKLDNVKILNSFDNWKPVRGTSNRIRTQHNGLLVSLEEMQKPNRKLEIEFCSFDDGIALKYRFPELDSSEMPEVIKEMTQIRVADDFTSWYLHVEEGSQKASYIQSKVSEINDPVSALIFERPGGAAVCIPQPIPSSLTSMKLKRDADHPLSLSMEITPSKYDILLNDSKFCETSWRAIIFGENAAKLPESKIIMVLNQSFFSEANDNRYDSILIADSASLNIMTLHREFSPEQSTIQAFEWSMVNLTRIQEHMFSVMTNTAGKEIIPGTLTQGLASLVLFYDPEGISVDLKLKDPDHPAWKFVENIPANWDNMIAVNGSVGDYLTIARKKGGDWFVGSITDESPRELKVPLDFLDENAEYEADIYSDGDSAHWQTNPFEYKYETRTVSKTDTLNIRLGPGGGQAIMIKSR